MSISSLWNFSRTTDDCGQTIKCRSLRAIRWQASCDPALVATSDRITVEWRAHYPEWQVNLLLVLGGVLLLISWKLFGSQPFFLQFAPALIFLSIAGLEMTRNFYRKMMPDITRILIEEGICAGCTYPLEGLSENSDGMLVCPECSASWLRLRIIRFTPIAKQVTARSVRGELSHAVAQVRRGLYRRGIRDDRSSPRAVISMRSARKICATLTGDHRARLDALVKTLRPKGRARRFLSAGVNVIFAGVMLAPFLLTGASVASVPLILFAPVPIIVTFLLISIILAISGDLGRPSKLVRTEFLRQDLCPCCAADLRGRSPDDDGCKTCPDCSAAWRVREQETASSAPTPPPSP